MPISGHDTDEVMNMKKFLGGIKKNIFYISLITGMAVLVTVLGLYNAQTNSKEKTITIGQNTPNDSTTEALNDKKNDKNSGVSDEGTSEQKDIETDNTIENSTASTAESESAETGASGVSNDSLHYDPKDSISWPINGNVIIPYSMDTTVYFETLKEYKCSPAMVIEAQTGDEVKAVYESKVAEVSSNPELGNYVKLELGDGYTGHDLPDFGDVVPVYYVISAIFYIILTCDKDYVINRTVLKGLERIIQYGIIPQRHKLLRYIAVHPAALSGCKDYCRDLYFIHCIKDFYI